MRKNIKWIIAGLAGVMAIAAVAAFLWWSDDGPAAVDLETAVAHMESIPSENAGDSSVTDTTDAGPTSTTGPETPAATTTAEAIDDDRSRDEVAETETTSADTTPVTETPDAAGTTSGAGPETTTTSTGAATDGAPPTEAETASADTVADRYTGLWAVTTPGNADGLPGEDAVSFAGFRVKEVLAGGIAESTAVGRTTAVEGFIELSGTTLVAATVEVEIAALRTDNSHRDSHMRQAMETNEFKLAVFTLVEPLELPIGVFEGETFSGSAVGDLTIKGVTNRATFDLKARLVGDTIVAVGSSGVLFGDYGVTAPTSASVIWVEDHGTMEFLLYFTR